MDRVKLQPANRRSIYDNILMVHPDGAPMCRLSARKARFYLRNGLAEEIPGDPPTIRLLFEPAGPGQAGNEYMLSARASRCVVCGTEESLTRHHVVPYCYRRHLPRRYTIRSSNYDVLVLCVEHHLQYEAAADQLKVTIAAELGVHTHGSLRVSRLRSAEQRIHCRASASANALLRYSATMPPERIQELQEGVAAYLGRPPTEEDLKEVAGHKANLDTSPPHGLQVVEKVEDVHAFVVRWRRHFIDTMNPAFLDSNWDPEQRFEH